jgi:hypothetical protein
VQPRNALAPIDIQFGDIVKDVSPMQSLKTLAFIAIILLSGIFIVVIVEHPSNALGPMYVIPEKLGNAFK